MREIWVEKRKETIKGNNEGNIGGTKMRETMRKKERQTIKET